jgi:putative oxidoreductase
MKIVSTIGRYLLGLVFTVFGLNGFLNFIPAQPVPQLAGQFVGALVESHFMTIVFGIEIVAGILLLVTKYVPLALTIIAPVIVNIVLFHAFMAPSGLPIAAFVSLLWIIVAYRVRTAFLGLFQPTSEWAFGRENKNTLLPHNPPAV